jgi:hypothetical protein
MASQYISVQMTPDQAKFLLVMAFNYPLGAFMVQSGAGPMELVADNEDEYTNEEDEDEEDEGEAEAKTSKRRRE